LAFGATGGCRLRFSPDSISRPGPTLARQLIDRVAGRENVVRRLLRFYGRMAVAESVSAGYSTGADRPNYVLKIVRHSIPLMNLLLAPTRKYFLIGGKDDYTVNFGKPCNSFVRLLSLK
jgi:hypothetical protein